MIGTSISHYRILEKLGEGGMGVVYKAEDTTLRRAVAIKVLPSDVAKDRLRVERFEREARAAAALNHPNVCVIFEVGRHEGDPFIAMELLEGRTLRDLMAFSGVGRPVPMDMVVEIAVQIADALVAAHAKGMVHRDIKPTNVFVTVRDEAKILDFGLAKLVGIGDAAAGSAGLATAGATVSSDNSNLTNPGSVVGTVAYMSPEQARGEDLDGRSDLFSFGALLYEMSAGQMAFQGGSAAALFGAILHETPAPLTRLNPQVPPELERIVSRALEKDRRLRFQTAGDMLADLKRLKRDLGLRGRSAPMPAHAVDTASDRLETIAVLPFENASGDPDAEYLSDGITESLINSLAQLGRLRVLARSTVFRYKGRLVDAQQIGRELNARAVLTGRVFHRGDTLVIGAELVDVIKGWQLWGERYKRSLTDIFDVQEEIARVIVDKLRVTLSPSEEQRLGKRQTDDPEAYRLFLKGLYFWNKWTDEGFRKAEDYFRRALDHDPTFAPAYAGIADILVSPPYMGFVSPRDVFPKAKAAIQQSLALNDSVPLTWFIAGIASMVYDWDMQAAEHAFRRAIDVGPGDARGYSGLGYVLGLQGRMEEAEEQARRAIELDPLTPIWTANAGLLYRWMRNHDAAAAELRKSLDVDPHFLLNRLELGRVHVAAGNIDEGIHEFRRSARDSNDHAFALGHLGYGLALAGNAVEAQACLQKLQEMAQQRYVPASASALIYLGLGDKDRTFECLERAVDDREARMSHLRVDPIYDSLRADRRFDALLGRVGIAGAR